VKTSPTDTEAATINNLRRALLNNWGIAPEDSVEGDGNASIQINVITDTSAAVAKTDQTGLFASLITHLPEQFMFLVKLILTAFLLLFSMSLLFSFMPDSLFEKENR
jgi:hypothetical protein